MAHSVRKLLNLMHLLRVELILTVVSDSWLMIFLAYELEPAAFRNAQLDAPAMSLALALFLGSVVAGGLAAYGLALNDVLDVRRDRAFSPDRPIAAGHIGLTTALSTAVVALLLALCGALLLGQGPALLTVLVAGGILFYNTTARFIPATGIVCLALVRMLHMFVPNPEASFVWPIWLNFTYTLVIAAAVYVLVAKRPRMTGAGWWLLAAAWTFWTVTLIGWMSWRSGQAAAPAAIWLGPIVASLAFAGIMAVLWLRSSIIAVRVRRTVTLLLSRFALLWLIVVNASWLLAGGYYWQGGAHLALFVIALAVGWLLTTYERPSPPRSAYRVYLGGQSRL